MDGRVYGQMQNGATVSELLNLDGVPGYPGITLAYASIDVSQGDHT